MSRSIVIPVHKSKLFLPLVILFYPPRKRPPAWHQWGNDIRRSVGASSSDMKTLFFNATVNEGCGEWKPEGNPQRREERAQGRFLQGTTGQDVPRTSEQESPPQPDQKRFTCPQLLCDKTFASKYKLCR